MSQQQESQIMEWKESWRDEFPFGQDYLKLIAGENNEPVTETQVGTTAGAESLAERGDD